MQNYTVLYAFYAGFYAKNGVLCTRGGADVRANISFGTHGYIHIRAPENFIL